MTHAAVPCRFSVSSGFKRGSLKLSNCMFGARSATLLRVLHREGVVRQAISREQTFDPRQKWALVPAFFAPGTRDTFSPGWWLQLGLKVPAQRLLRQAFAGGDF